MPIIPDPRKMIPFVEQMIVVYSLSTLDSTRGHPEEINKACCDLELWYTVNSMGGQRSKVTQKWPDPRNLLSSVITKAVYGFLKFYMIITTTKTFQDF